MGLTRMKIFYELASAFSRNGAAFTVANEPPPF
jgi:hypothetical protein